LNKGSPFDLLSDRTAQTLAEWLKMHLGIEIINPDRSSSFANAARTGAPQVARAV